jgi:Zn finger protein HypA/HybF involved in hydrogenase expression
MHAEVIAKEIVKKAKSLGDVQMLNLEVGDLAPANAEDLQAEIQKLVEWPVKITKIKGEIECACGYVGEVKVLEKRTDITFYVCPKCGSVPLKVLKGNKIKIKSIKKRSEIISEPSKQKDDKEEEKESEVEVDMKEEDEEEEKKMGEETEDEVEEIDVKSYPPIKKKKVTSSKDGDS